MIRRRQVSRILWWAVSGRRSEGDAMQEKDNIDCDDDLMDGCGLLRWEEQWTTSVGIYIIILL